MQITTYGYVDQILSTLFFWLFLGCSLGLFDPLGAIKIEQKIICEISIQKLGYTYIYQAMRILIFEKFLVILGLFGQIFLGQILKTSIVTLSESARIFLSNSTKFQLNHHCKGLWKLFTPLGAKNINNLKVLL